MLEQPDRLIQFKDRSFPKELSLLKQLVLTVLQPERSGCL